MSRPNFLKSLSDNIVIDKNKCTFCGICVETCVLDNLRLELSPCRRACPLGVNCQGYVQLIARDQPATALELLRETLPFPGILARICSQPCEDNCHRKAVTGEAVAIRALKRYLVDQHPGGPVVPEIPGDSGRRVAIVGSGPAGLMAAYDTRLNGHDVTVFEAESEPGGMLRWAIPEFRLPLEVLNTEIDMLNRMGVRFSCGRALGREIELDRLGDEYDAVILALGCRGHQTLDLENRDLPGIRYGLSLLREVRAGLNPEVPGHAAVIGGGNAAVDAAQTALRLGASKVTMISLEQENDLPAFRHALEGARADGIGFECGWGPLRFIERDGRVGGIELQRCISVFDSDGRFRPCFDACEIRVLEVDSVIVAIGQQPDFSCLNGTRILEGDTVRADALTLQTAQENIFVAGDMLTGPSSAVKAMAEGRKAAESVDRYLKEEHLGFGRTYAGPVLTEFDIDTARAADAPRVEVPVRVCSGPGDFQETEAGLDHESARREASRCYSCGQPVGEHRTCWFCLPCEVECPHDALWVEVPYLLR